MQYLLDTNVLIALMNQPWGRVGLASLRVQPSELVTSAVVMHELYFGIYKSERREKNFANVERLRLAVLLFDREDARVAGQIRAQLHASGTPIGPYDVLIAGQALRHNLTLVTANLREFARVPGLRCEDWSV